MLYRVVANLACVLWAYQQLGRPYDVHPPGWLATLSAGFLAECYSFFLVIGQPRRLQDYLLGIGCRLYCSYIFADIFLFSLYCDLSCESNKFSFACLSLHNNIMDQIFVSQHSYVWVGQVKYNGGVYVVKQFQLGCSPLYITKQSMLQDIFQLCIIYQLLPGIGLVLLFAYFFLICE